MKHLIMIIALLAAAPVLAQEVKEIQCTSNGVKSTIILAEGVLMDDIERIIATETSTGRFESIDSQGKVVYTIHGNEIVMQFDGITKEYVCDL